jgi:hypothetical protein
MQTVFTCGIHRNHEIDPTITRKNRLNTATGFCFHKNPINLNALRKIFRHLVMGNSHLRKFIEYSDD